VTARREVWITGVGLLTCLGEGLESVWSHLERGDPPPYDDKSFAPYVVHPLAPMSFDKQIPKKSDQRQMETWQRVGVYTAGLALSDAGIAGKLVLSEGTVRNYLSAAMAKVGARNRAEAVRIADERGWL